LRGPCRRRPRFRGQGGFAYLAMLFAIAFMELGLAAVAQVWHTVSVREREVQLLHVGNQYRRAIEQYHAGGLGDYPRSLDDLLKDPRKPGVARYLRRLYADPVTNSDRWGLVMAADGGIMGVYSLSESLPMKLSGFSIGNSDFEGAQRYMDWKFFYSPSIPLGPVIEVPEPATP